MQTKDVIVSVVGTLFFVNAEEKGSRVAVIEGEVQVHGGIPKRNSGEHRVEASQGKIIAKNGEMSRFVWFLSQVLDRPVVDRTGLNAYDFVFVQPTTILPSPDTNELPIFDALQDQLGLRLESGKGPVEFLVIDLTRS